MMLTRELCSPLRTNKLIKESKMAGVHNWRVNLTWPASLAKEEYDVEYLYEDDDGKTVSSFSEAIALAAMLLAEAVFLNSNWWEKDWPEDARKTVAICVNTSDVFMWGCADAETITHKEIEEVYRYWVKDPKDGTTIWAMIHNKQMPQRPVEESIRKAGIWDIDAIKAEHSLRANHYDGISHVLAMRKRDLYTQWCADNGNEPLPFDGGWWEGWKAYVSAHPNWNDDAWKAEDDRLCDDWRITNGY